ECSPQETALALGRSGFARCPRRCGALDVALMKTCPFCTIENDDSYRFCRQCGQPLDSLVLSSDEPAASGASTVLLQNQTSVRPRRSVPLATLFARQRQLIVGRAPDCDICLQHPSVSRYHALLVRLAEGVQVSDLGSVN